MYNILTSLCVSVVIQKLSIVKDEWIAIIG